MIEEWIENIKGIWERYYSLSGLISLILLMANLFLVALFLIGPKKREQSSPDFPKVQEVIKTASPAIKESPDMNEDTTIMVDIKGAVQKEGVYQLAKGSRLTDAIALAGGLKAEADKEAINLAEKLSDEQLIYVARQGENRSLIDVTEKESMSVTSSQGVGKDKLNPWC
ncbi:SLBB domain-containing protein [Streptococcus ictaluri]|uniref:SLBB domain protein n=1 Tax=Streptococcus ictaluri 707-05 TaxID=764299 RepID=G5K5X8_9STRE|nr:SLBB domain-containing protein [Streptococcus ictaluri]EHI68628.1 SLBB domain protein [Streptococcus ictaluri 707-05]